LLEGLRQHKILKDLARYLEERVPELHRSAGKVRKQVPLVIPEPDWKVNEPILNDYVTEIDVSLLEKKAIGFELDEDFDEAKQLWRKVIELSPVQSQRSDALKAIDRIDIKISRYAPKPTELSEVPLFKGDLGGSSSPKPIDRLAVEEAIPLAPLKRGNRSGEGSQAIVYPTFKFEYATIDRNLKIQKHRGEAYHFRETINGVDFELVQIPAGSFEMGSHQDASEKPIHHVTVPEFFMGKYPVTQAQWKTIANLKQKNRKLNPNPSRFKGVDRPVENVYWEDAVEFCDRLSDYTGKLYRLPSEAEWEYSCRAGTTTQYHFGDASDPTLANYENNCKGTTTVGKFPGNPWGLFDCHGNVWEWCEDVWHRNYINAPTDGSSWITGANTEHHSGRGGSWAFPAVKFRSASRNNYTRAFLNGYVGFRLVLSMIVPEVDRRNTKAQAQSRVHTDSVPSQSTQRPKNFAEEYRAAEKAYMQGRYEDAAELIDRLVLQCPNDPPALLLRGHVYCYGLHLYDIASAQYQGVINVTSDKDYIDYANQGLTYARSCLEEGSK
jgi:formylglycine-generating enzyme required for sulfatase activity